VEGRACRRRFTPDGSWFSFPTLALTAHATLPLPALLASWVLYTYARSISSKYLRFRVQGFRASG
jgi:hypothetical protein